MRAGIENVTGVSPKPKPDDIKVNVDALTLDLIDAWKLVYDAAEGKPLFSNNYQRDMEVLKQVRNMLSSTNSTMLTRLGERSGLIAILQSNHNAPCYTCKIEASERSNMSDFLTHVAYFAQNYGQITSSSSVIGGQGMKSQQLWQVNAAAHMIRFMYDDKGSTFAPTAFEQSYMNPNPFPNCRVDAQIGTGGNKTVCEFKSWSLRGDVQDEEGRFDNDDIVAGCYQKDKSMFFNFGSGCASTKQFQCYLQQISSMSNFRYYFDARRAGVTETIVKNTFRQMMYDADKKDANGQPDQLTDEGKLVFEAIWGNALGLKVNLFPEINFTQPDNIIKPIGLSLFKDKISSIANSFYNFIRVR